MRASPVHALPPELARSAPRDVGLTTGGRALMALSWLLAAAAFFAAAGLQIDVRRQAAAAADFERRAVTVGAVVDRLWRKSGDDEPAYAAFHFDANGTRVEIESRMRRSVWRELRTGSTMAVRYLPENPRDFEIGGERRDGMPFVVPYAISLPLAALSLLCATAVRRQRALLSEGRPASAVVTKVKKNKGAHGASYREIFYEFRVLAGTKATGKAVATTGADVGGTISVVYHPERPTRNRPYPFSLVTLNRE